MIEINLLPPEYRYVERAPFAAVAGTIVGVLILSLLGFYWFMQTNRTRGLADDLEQRKRQVRTLEIQAKEVELLEKEKIEAEQRLEYIKALTRQRIFWGQKLFQLQHILGQAEDIWISRLSLSPSGTTSKLQIQVEIKGDQFTSHTRALSFFHNDYNFIHHFRPSKTFPSEIVRKDGFIPDKVLKTTLEFEVRPLTERTAG